MKFIFVCLEKEKVFESASFKIISNKGIALDMQGNKVLDAKVTLNKPCPFCGIKHVYHARELSCPFERPEREENPIKDNTHGG